VAETSSIEWTDATWNPVTGCSVVSPGCTNCYAMKLAGTRLQHHPSRAGLTRDTKAGPVWTGAVRLNEQWLSQPLRWRRPRRVFVCAHGDLFHESVPDEWIDRVFAVMALAPQHTFQVLTKRAERMRAYFVDQHMRLGAVHDEVIELRHCLRDAAERPTPASVVESWPLPNIWLGVSAEDQARASQRIPDLLATPAAVRFVSAEPLLGPIDLECLDLTFVESREKEPSGLVSVSALDGIHFDCEGAVSGVYGNPDPRLDWVIVGGESGHDARPMQVDWARSLRDQCAAAGVPFFFKQWGAYAPTSDCNGPYMMHVGKKAAGRRLDGQLHDAMPEASG
jgi:protein gp37